MIFKSLMLENFRQFSGRNTIEFSMDKEKNITVVHAMNGSGKTTLVEALRWALYGGVLNLEHPREVLNRSLAENDGTYEVGVEVNFIHNQIQYNLKRYYHNLFVRNKVYTLPKNKVELTFHDETNQLCKLENDQAQLHINDIFSQAVANYFFYDGERIEKLGENNISGGKDISNGMDSIMSVIYMKSLLNRLKRGVLPSLNDSYDQDARIKLIKLDKHIEALEDEAQKLENLVIDIEMKIANNTQKIKKLDEEIIKYKVLEEAQKEIIHCETEIKKNQELLKTLSSGIVINRNESKRTNQSIPSVTTKYVKQSLLEVMIKETMPKLNEIEIIPQNIQGLTSELLDRIEASGSCVCGNEVTAAALLNLKNMLSETKEHELLNREFNDFKSLMKAQLGTLDSFYAFTEFDRIKMQYQSKKIKNQQLKDRIQVLQAQQNQEFDVSAKHLEKEQLQTENNRFNQRLGEVKREVNDNNKEQKSTTTELETIRNSAKANAKTEKTIEQVREIIEYTEQVLAQEMKDVEITLADKTASIFEQMAHKGTKYIDVITTPYYQYEVYDKMNGKQSSLSEGERNIASLSFIAGIISAAKKHYSSSLFTGEDGNKEIPLVLDSPFAKLDSAHIRNVSKIIPEIADQIILFTVDQQFQGAAQEMVVHKIGKQYVMDNAGDSTVRLTVK